MNAWIIAAMMLLLLPGGSLPHKGSEGHRATESLSSQEQSGSVAGKVEIRASAQLIKRERGGKYQSMPSMTEQDNREEKPSEQKNVIVYLEGPRPETSDSRETARVSMDQKNAVFYPHVLAVRKGTTVDFVNHDNTYHNVFSLSPVKRFNIGRRPTGEAVPVLFDKPGVVQIFCDIHSQMTAFVVVLENPFFAQPSDDGTFKLDHIPPGTYTLKVWHERLAAADQKIVVTAGSTVRVNPVLE